MPLNSTARGEVIAAATRRFSQALLDLLFPPRCAVCRRAAFDLCPDCLHAFIPLGHAICVKCSTPLEESGLCHRCAQSPPAFVQVMSAFRYEGAVREAIHALKYRRRTTLAEPLAQALVSVIPSPPCEVDLLCAVPLHREKLARRGYNHAELLMNALIRWWPLPTAGRDALERLRPTPTQVSSDYATRLANVEGAFAAQREAVQGRTVLVVDDVCTTGATLSACALALLTAGARAVYGVTLARTP